ncbi:MAG: S1 RNA-binding domain-containing protein, partial [Planktomarina sp.]|nr:S1 RNA-binding domain-containing protein [Planktomarina sp.]MDT2058344.1 ribonuclease E/G [Planktomarina sp.]
MAKKMLIDATHAEETRVVVVDGNKVEEFDFESQNKRQIAGNIYLAKITRVEPSLQAAFIDYGGNRHGFLAFSEIHPDYYQIPVADREALLAEEKAYAESLAAEVEREEQKPKRNRRRRAKPATQSNSDPLVIRDVVAVDGMETIDLSDDDTQLVKINVQDVHVSEPDVSEDLVSVDASFEE